MKVCAGRPTRIAHITNPVAARYFLSDFNPDLRQVAIACFNTKGVLNLDQTAVTI